MLVPRIEWSAWRILSKNNRGSQCLGDGEIPQRVKGGNGIVSTAKTRCEIIHMCMTVHQLLHVCITDTINISLSEIDDI